MGRYSHAIALPYRAEQVFDLVADVERYPEFLPFWTAARVRRRDGDILYVDQVIRLAFLQWRFSSEAELDRPRRLRITSAQAPFRHLEIAWTFEEQESSECLVGLEASYALRSRLTERLAERLMDAAIRQFAKAFEERARNLLGDPEPGSKA